MGCRALLPAIPLGRDVGARAMVGNELEDGAGVAAAAVGDGVPGRLKAVKEGRHGSLVGGLARGENEAARQAKAVDDDVDFGAQPASRASDGVIRTPFFPPAACWWAQHHRGVEEMKRPRRARRQRLEQALPHPLLGPAVVAVADCRMRPAALRKVAPRRAGAQDVKDPADRPPVVHPWNAPRLVRQQRRDDRPFRIRQIVPALHPQSPTVWKLESHQSRKENPFPLYEYTT